MVNGKGCKVSKRRTTSKAFLALLLVGTLLLCHGFFGPAHQLVAEAGSAADEVSALLGIPTGPGDGPDSEAEDANFAAVLLLMLGWLLWLSWTSSPRRRVSPAALGSRAFTASLEPNHRMRPITPLLQVFRL
jgi:hypothetical protein